ncbi:hypothetical protein [Streptomyces huasconensis]|uniref:hypothetical protein n=1 Tax=Streptomyces huasconensis TaxID=1854574 RepID=UPI003701E345
MMQPPKAPAPPPMVTDVPKVLVNSPQSKDTLEVVEPPAAARLGSAIGIVWAIVPAVPVHVLTFMAQLPEPLMLTVSLRGLSAGLMRLAAFSLACCAALAAASAASFCRFWTIIA